MKLFKLIIRRRGIAGNPAEAQRIAFLWGVFGIVIKII